MTRIGTVAPVGGLLAVLAGAGAAQEPVVNMSEHEIVQVGFVVPDAAATAKQYGEIFGIGPWDFYDLALDDVELHGKSIADGDSVARVALAQTQGLQLELIQPLSGPSTHREFLAARGAGVHHLSFGSVADHDAIVSRLESAGVEVEMQGLIGDAIHFTYLSTEARLGTIFELVRPWPAGAADALRPWGTYEPPRSPRVDAGDRRIVQVGIVVADAEGAARNYWELFGVGPWTLIDFVPPHVAEGVLHGIPMREDGDIHIRGAIAMLGDLQLELLEPVRGPSTHMEFLQRFGNGVHHLSFGAIADHDEVVAALVSGGIEIEMTGLLGGAGVFTYLASQRELGTIYELVKTLADRESTLLPYGTYPPAE